MATQTYPAHTIQQNNQLDDCGQSTERVSFSAECGCQQGDPVSSLLCAELLACRAHENN